MKLEWITLIRMLVGTYFLLLFAFGLSGYIGKGYGFKQKEILQQKFGNSLGKLIHFGKVVLMPLILGAILTFEPILKFFRVLN